MKKISFLLLSLFILASCSQDLLESSAPAVDGKEVKVPLSFSVAPMTVKVMGSKGVSTRSVTPSDMDETAIADMWVIQFDKDGNFVKKYYNPTVDVAAFDASLAATPTGQVSHLYFLANVGPTLASPDNETNFQTQIKPIAAESDLYVVKGGKKCIPMFASNLTAFIPYTGYIDKLDVELKRMLARVEIICNLDANLPLDVKSARVCNIPMGIQLCPPAAAGDGVTSTTKVINLPSEDITFTDNSCTLVYYLPDNQKGIGTNTAGGERFKAGKDDATYIEISGYTTGANGGEEIGYRIYPGNDVTNNYNIIRNTKYEITTTLKNISSSDQRIRIHERPNCYIVAPGASVNIPAKHANDSPEIGVQIPDVAGTWTPVVYWQTAAGLVTVARTAGDGYFTVTAPDAAAEGNALVAIKDGDGNILWSWHIWVMAADINRPDSWFASNSCNFMDRNLGATDPGNSLTTGFKSYATSAGLLYQWGRKDPFTLCVSTLDGKTPINLYNAAGTAFLPNATYYSGLTVTQAYASDPYTYCLNIANYGYDKGLAASIKYPALYMLNWYGSTAVSNNSAATNGSDSWGGEYGQPKSVYDPCPEGWRVPSYKRTSSSAASTLYGGSLVYTSANQITASTTAFNSIYISGRYWYFPYCGYRSTDGQIYNVGHYSRSWGATTTTSGSSFFTDMTGDGASAPTWVPNQVNSRTQAYNIRCARLW